MMEAVLMSIKDPTPLPRVEQVELIGSEDIIS